MDDPASCQPLPHRYDIYLAITALACYLTLAAFAATQAVPGLRMVGYLRTSIVLWLLVAGGTAAICWLARPQLVHIAFIFEVARRLKVDAVPNPLPPVKPRQLVARRAIWSACGSIATSCFTLAAFIDLGVGVGIVNLRGQNLVSVSLVILSTAVVTTVTRIVGPNLAEIDEAYRVAITHAARDQGVTDLAAVRAARR